MAERGQLCFNDRRVCWHYHLWLLYIQPHLGYKKTLIGALVAQIAFIFAVFFAETLPVLFVGQFLCGLPWGAFNAIAQAYGSEIAPLPLRGMYTMYNQSCWCTGQLITSAILYAFREGTSKVFSPSVSANSADIGSSGLTRFHSLSNGYCPCL